MTNHHSAPPTRHSAWAVWTNPIFRRYCQSRLRPAALGAWLLMVVLIAGFMVSLALAAEARGVLELEDAARGPVIPLLVLQSLIVFVLGTAQTAGGMTAERDEGVIDYQRLAPMSPLSKVAGYLFGLPVREYVMFAVTLPFTAWCLWKGGVSWRVWLPLYGVFFSSALLYHLTGLLTGMVARNRRWAFLASIGLVFALYTVIPQLSKFGLVFFKYLTITPVLEEAFPWLLPKDAGALVKTGQQLAPEVKFFGLDFPEAVFTVFSQGGLILAFLVMLRRKWRRQEAHLLGKLWGLGLFVWIHVLLLGNALPLVDSGRMFPSREFTRRVWLRPDWRPDPVEALAMSAVYGLVTLGLILLLGAIITPTPDRQREGWRRARKLGQSHIPWLADAGSGWWFTLAMTVAGGAAWFVFTRAVVECRWFPGHTVPLEVLGWFIAALAAVAMAGQALLEWRGAPFTRLVVILVGVVPLMAGSVVCVIGRGLYPLGVWLLGMSPLSLPAYAAGSRLSVAELPDTIVRAVPHAFEFWLTATLLAAGWLALRLHASRRKIAEASRAPDGAKPD